MHSSPRLRIILRTAWLAAIAMVIAGSLLPPQSAPMEVIERLDVSDKLLHFGAYFVLALLPALHEGRRRAVILAAVAFALGALLEFLQPSFGRDFEMGDMLADASGAVCGLGLGSVAAFRRL